VILIAVVFSPVSPRVVCIRLVCYQRLFFCAFSTPEIRCSEKAIFHVCDSGIERYFFPLMGPF